MRVLKKLKKMELEDELRDRPVKTLIQTPAMTLAI